MISLAFLMTINNVVYADDAVPLIKGQQAPFTGILLTEEKANTVYNDLSRFKLLNESLERSIKLYEQNEQIQEKKINILLIQNDKLSTDLMTARSASNWEKVLWFGLGLVSVGLSIYGVKAITK